jgi:hypothetical protein
MEEPEKIPDWLITGILPKSGSGKVELIANRAKLCHLGCKECKNNFMISKSIYEECKKRINNLRIAWIDYQEAFDCVTRSWIEKSIALVEEKSKTFKFR